MDVVLVGLPGCGKSAVGRRLARRHGAAFVDLDELIEQRDGRTVEEIFAESGEAGFRAIEREAIASLAPGDPSPRVSRIIATGGGAVVDPRNRWLLYRNRLPIWLDGPPEAFGQRLRKSPHVRPLVQGRDPGTTLRQLAAARRRFYAPAVSVNAVAQMASILEAIDGAIAEWPLPSTTVLRADTAIGRIEIGDRIAGEAVASALSRLGARRAILLSEPNAWQAAGAQVAETLADAEWPVERIDLPSGEDAKRLSVIEGVCRRLAQMRVERREPVVAIGGGALTDAAGFAAAVYLRGVPVIHVPTTLVAQVDASIGGKTAVDIPEGKNLVGAFHQPAAVILDVAFLATLPERERRAALGEVVKMAALGDERLLELIESDGELIARGDPCAAESGALAEAVERCAWAKVEVVTADEREAGKRMILNLGHTIGHGIEAAAGFRELLHGEAVAYGLRGAFAMARALDMVTAERADRIESVLDRLGLAVEPPGVSADAVREHMARDKKVAAGRVHWVLPTDSEVAIRSDVPDEVVTIGIAAALRSEVALAGHQGVDR